MTDDIYYFGCWREPGHFLRSREGVRHEHNLPADFPCPLNMLDGGFLPPKLPDVQGRATCVHLNRWTILSFWDRSVDKRPGCNSAFIIRGYHTFSEAVRLAKERFPEVWGRFTFTVYEDV
jgi:hypothetical protein